MTGEPLSRAPGKPGCIPVDADTLALAVDLIGSAAAREHAAEARGFARGEAHGYEAGYRQGRADESDARDADWQQDSRAILALADPKGPEARAARESADRRVRAAEAGERRDALAHWHGFIRRARETPPHLRTEPQRGVLRLIGDHFSGRGAA